MPSRPWSRARYRAPAEHGEILSLPDLASAAALAAANRESLSTAEWAGQSLAELRAQARGDMLAAARDYHAALGLSVPPAPADGLVFMTGHQPALVHPGVWAKNFAVAALAKTGGLGLNLVVDGDLAPPPSVATPMGGPGAPRVQQIAYDVAQPAAPWEEVQVTSAETFASFGERLTHALAPWNITPILAGLWPEIAQQAESLPQSASTAGVLPRLTRVCDLFTAARGRQERGWGAGNFELPQSRLCELPTFDFFVSRMLARAGEFGEVHNGLLRDYRVAHRLRGNQQPVPDLTVVDGWSETPFRVWRAGSRVRGRLFCRAIGKTLEVRDESRVIGRLSAESTNQQARDEWQAIRDGGYKIRTRALTTTLFVRLFAADLFIHGIGGAKYDEITDRLLLEFFGVPVPRFLTLTATLKLPLPVQPGSHAVERYLMQRERELRFQAERTATLGAEGSDLVDRKRRLIDAARRVRDAGPRPSSKQLFASFQGVNRALAALTSGERAAIQGELATVRRHIAANRILESREFAAWLFPAASLQQLTARIQDEVINS